MVNQNIIHNTNPFANKMDDISTSVLAMASKASISSAATGNNLKHAQGSMEMMRKLRNNGVHVVIANRINKSDALGKKQKAKNSSRSQDDGSGDEEELKYSFIGNDAFVIEVFEFDYDEFGLEKGDKVPDFSIDPDTLIFTVINYDPKVSKAFFISFLHPCLPIFDANDKTLKEGIFIDDDGNSHPCVTLILYIPPMTVIDCCRLSQHPSKKSKTSSKKKKTDNKKGKKSSQSSGAANEDSTATSKLLPALFSDIRPINIYLDPPLFEIKLLEIKIPNYGRHRFPLDGQGPYVCSQGMGELFTHHFAETFHAIDIDCPIGTDVVAVADGIVIDVKQDKAVSGIHCCNLWAWNSMALKLDDGGVVEYVHIQKDSVCRKVGDHVKRGEVICQTGGVGFCPTPHLHIQFHLSDDPKAPTVAFAFSKTQPRTSIEDDSAKCKDDGNHIEEDDDTFIPTTGSLCNAQGIVSKI